MNYVWNFEGVRVMSVTTNRWNGPELWTSGYVMLRNSENIVQWEAKAMPSGYYIIVTSESGKVGEYQGVTFNLPLEVATAFRRLL